MRRSRCWCPRAVLAGGCTRCIGVQRGDKDNKPPTDAAATDAFSEIAYATTGLHKIAAVVQGHSVAAVMQAKSLPPPLPHTLRPLSISGSSHRAIPRTPVSAPAPADSPVCSWSRSRPSSETSALPSRVCGNSRLGGSKPAPAIPPPVVSGYSRSRVTTWAVSKAVERKAR